MSEYLSHPMFQDVFFQVHQKVFGPNWVRMKVSWFTKSHGVLLANEEIIVPLKKYREFSPYYLLH